MRATITLVMRQRLDDAFFDGGEKGDGLQGLAQAHVVREAAAEAVAVKESQPRVARVLVVAQRGLERGRQGFAVQRFEGHQRFEHTALRRRQLAFDAVLLQQEPVQDAHAGDAHEVGEILALAVLGLVFFIALAMEQIAHATEPLDRAEVDHPQLAIIINEVPGAQEFLPLILWDQIARASHLGPEFEEVQTLRLGGTHAAV